MENQYMIDIPDKDRKALITLGGKISVCRAFRKTAKTSQDRTKATTIVKFASEEIARYFSRQPIIKAQDKIAYVKPFNPKQIENKVNRRLEQPLEQKAIEATRIR